MSTMPNETPNVKPARKPSASKPRPRPPLMLDAYVLKISPAGGHPGCTLLTITSPGKRKGEVLTTAYVLASNPNGEGLAYRLTKLTATGALAGEVYDVLLTIADDELPDDRCDCKGNTSAGHCKHVQALRKLLDADQL
jgi:hypothetical protein